MKKVYFSDMAVHKTLKIYTLCKVYQIDMVHQKQFQIYNHNPSSLSELVIKLHVYEFETRSTRRAQTSLAEADHYSHIF